MDEREFGALHFYEKKKKKEYSPDNGLNLNVSLTHSVLETKRSDPCDSLTFVSIRNSHVSYRNVYVLMFAKKSMLPTRFLNDKSRYLVLHDA